MSIQTKTSVTEKQRETNITEERLSHKISTLLLELEQFSTAGMALIGAGLVLLVWGGWYVAGHGRAAVIGSLFALFLAADTYIVANLPRWRLSFGAWQPQVFQLAFLRLVAALVLAAAAVWLSSAFAFSLFILVQLAGTAALIYGTVIDTQRLHLTQLSLETDRLPAAAQPIRLLHISDLHVEHLTQWEEKLLQLAAQARPDLVVITGDYANISYNRDPETHAQIRHLLRRLDAPHDFYTTLGTPPVDLRDVIPALFDDLPVQLLRNEWRTVDLGDGRRLALLGMDCTHELLDDTAVLERLTPHAPNGPPHILLYHSPELMPQVAARGFDLYLCGHTHGGQVRLPFYGAILTSSQLGKRYEMGHYHEGRTHLYISRGIRLEGMSAVRVRFLCPPEITLVTIRGAG